MPRAKIDKTVRDIERRLLALDSVRSLRRTPASVKLLLKHHRFDLAARYQTNGPLISLSGLVGACTWENEYKDLLITSALTNDRDGVPLEEVFSLAMFLVLRFFEPEVLDEDKRAVQKVGATFRITFKHAKYLGPLEASYSSDSVAQEAVVLREAQIIRILEP